MRKYFFILTLIVFTLTTFQACKKEEVNTQEFVKNHIIGKWPLKARTETTYKDDIIISDTTFKYPPTDTSTAPVDTLLFTADGKYTKKGVTVNYTIDASGEQINYDTSPPSSWKIKYLRNTSIILTQERTEKIGTANFRYYIEEQLIK
ncbi:MAG: hypothetical protein V4541_02090 [Bacteroidota bacterium]